MSQTEEDRIRAHYKALKKRVDQRAGGLSTVWLQLARHWKRPVQELKQIVGVPVPTTAELEARRMRAAMNQARPTCWMLVGRD